jgi:hypothetical protein
MSTTRSYKGWEIMKCGGHITMSRFEAFKDGKLIWAFRLREVKAMIDSLDQKPYEELPQLYRKPLYI